MDMIHSETSKLIDAYKAETKTIAKLAAEHETSNAEIRSELRSNGVILHEADEEAANTTRS